jgi:shikimate kinase
MNIILFGFKKSGKTLFGKQLAAACQRPFVDTDSVVETIFAQETGQLESLYQIIQKIGFNAFRALEKKAVQSLQQVKKSVIAVGGGTVLDPDTINQLEQLGQMVYLKASKENLKKRVLSGELPLFLDKTDPEGSFEKMYTQRLPLYEAISAVTLDTEGKSAKEVVLELRQIWRVDGN